VELCQDNIPLSTTDYSIKIPVICQCGNFYPHPLTLPKDSFVKIWNLLKIKFFFLKNKQNKKHPVKQTKIKAKKQRALYALFNSFL